MGIHGRPVAGEAFDLKGLADACQEGEETCVPGILVGQVLGAVDHMLHECLVLPALRKLQLPGGEHGEEEGEEGGCLLAVFLRLLAAEHGDAFDPEPGVPGHGMEQIHFPQTVLHQLVLEKLLAGKVALGVHGEFQGGAFFGTGHGAGGAAEGVVDGDAVFRWVIDDDLILMLCHLDSLRFLFWEDYTI